MDLTEKTDAELIQDGNFYHESSQRLARLLDANRNELVARYGTTFSITDAGMFAIHKDGKIVVQFNKKGKRVTF